MNTKQFLEEFALLKKLGMNKYLETKKFKNRRRTVRNLSRVKSGLTYKIRFHNNDIKICTIKTVFTTSFTAIEKNTNCILDIYFSDVKRVLLL